MFPSNSMLIELEKLEEIFPKYQPEMRVVSNFIRTNIWTNFNELRLFQVLSSLNYVFDLAKELLPLHDLETILFYVNLLRKYLIKLSIFDNEKKWDELIHKIAKTRFKKIITIQWEEINPYYDLKHITYAEFKKGFMDIFDEAFTYCTLNAPNLLTKELVNIKYLFRGRKGKLMYPDLIPDPKRAMRLNRWNPPGKCFMYLVYGIDNKPYRNYPKISHSEMVCLEELRAEKKKLYSVCQFKTIFKSKNNRVVDLSYNDITFADIERNIDSKKYSIMSSIITDLINQYPVCPPDNILRVRINAEMKKYDIKNIALEHISKMYFKSICDNIFTPLDKDEDKNEESRKRRYGSFHILSEYLIDKGYAGIIYPSTRASTINEVGKNLVLFNVTDATYIEGTMRFIKYDYM